ncbi:hypothetical protein PGB90_006214 [Kerria lacca]
MVIFSKFRSLTLIPKRNFSRFPFEGLPTDPFPYIKKFAHESHGKHLLGIYSFSLWVIIPIFTAYAFYHEYEELVVHKKRIPFPKQDFLHAATVTFPWGDGKHTPMHHPYYNFTKYGYETDKDGNPLPPGVYAME